MIKNITLDEDFRLVEEETDKQIMQLSSNDTVLNILFPKSVVFSTLYIAYKLTGSTTVTGTYAVSVNSTYISDDYYNVVFGLPQAMLEYSGKLEVYLVYKILSGSTITQITYSEAMIFSITRTPTLDENSIDDLDIVDTLNNSINDVATRVTTLEGISFNVYNGSHIFISGMSGEAAFVIDDTTKGTYYKIDYHITNNGTASITIKVYYTATEYQSYTLAVGESTTFTFSSASAYYWTSRDGVAQGVPETESTYNYPIKIGVSSTETLYVIIEYQGVSN